MTISTHLRTALELPTLIVQGYLNDLTDDELLVRPHPEMNHIAWQLGHLIVGENFHMSQLRNGSMAPLPEGFGEQHSKQTATIDSPSAFLPKSDYLRLMAEQRATTLQLLASLSDEELLQSAPENIRYLGPTVGAVFAGEGTHWMMHAGQWAVVRRMLGRPPLY